MTTPKERMSEERLDQLRSIAVNWRGAQPITIYANVAGLVAVELADEINRLRAELTAARTVGLENYNRACRERDEARARAEFAEAQLKGTNANIAGWLAARDAQMERANLAERQLDESLAGHRQKAEAFDAIRLLAGQGMDDHDLERTAAGYLQRISVIADRRALAADHAIGDDMKSALSLALVERDRARTDALEEAAKWHDQRRRDTPDAFEMEFHQVSANAIRALKPTQESETP